MLLSRVNAATVALLLAVSLPAVVTAASGSTEQRLELLERRVGRVTELTLQLDEMRRENRQLRGEVERLGYAIEQLERKQRDIYLDIDQRLGALGGEAPAAAAETPSAVVAPPSGAATPAPVSDADRARIQAEYDAAYALLGPQQKRYGDAAKAFAAFVQKYPRDRLAANAQYWLGEAYYVSQQNAAALTAFDKVVAEYPRSTKASGALFKIGRLHEASGRRSDARKAYARVINDYPDSPAAGLARERLKQLGR